MKVELSLGSKQLIIKPETDFETDCIRKYFQQEETKTKVTKSGCLFINWTSPAREEED